jgi:hypothetical protein
MAAAAGNMVLTFGKYKGRAISQVPDEYLRWLCQWCTIDSDEGRLVLANVADEEIADLDYFALEFAKQSPTAAEAAMEWLESKQTWGDGLALMKAMGWKPVAALWLSINHWPVVVAARKEFRRRCICFRCLGRLVPIGSARLNGAAHDDWDARLFHKCCWKEEHHD